MWNVRIALKMNAAVDGWHRDEFSAQQQTRNQNKNEIYIRAKNILFMSLHEDWYTLPFGKPRSLFPAPLDYFFHSSL